MGKLGIVSNSIVYIYGEYTYSQNTAKNQTTLTTKVILTCYGGGAGYDTFNGGVQIGGNFYSGSAININLAAAGTYVLYSRTDTFTHNDDGSFPSGWGLQFNCGNAGAYSYSSHIYLHSVIPKIPRISSIANTTSTSNRLEFGNSVDFEISRFSNSYTHDLTFKVDGTTYTIGTDLDTSASYIFGIDLIEKFINTDVPTITVTCTTKNGDTTIGTSNTTVYLSVPSSYVPTCSLVLSDAGSVPSEWGVYVKTKSKIKGIITAIGSAGSTISNYNSTANNQTFTTQEFTTSELTSTGEMVVNSTVTDSRGRQASDSKTVNVIDYWTPSISSYSVERCNADGTLNEDGTYGKVIVKYSIAPIENHNTKSLVVKYRDATKTFTLDNYNGTYESTEYFTDLATNSSHVFEIYICDYFNSDIKFTFTMTPSYCTISKLAGGKGVTFGQVATEEGLHSYMDATFHAKIEGIYDVGDIFLSTNNVNPSIKFGGTWELIAEGKTLIGAGTGTDINGVEKTFNIGDEVGEYEHTLTLDEMPKHSHRNTHYVVGANAPGYGGWENTIGSANDGSNYRASANTNEMGGDEAHNNIQPSFVCYIWQRIA